MDEKTPVRNTCKRYSRPSGVLKPPSDEKKKDGSFFRYRPFLRQGLQCLQDFSSSPVSEIRSRHSPEVSLEGVQRRSKVWGDLSPFLLGRRRTPILPVLVRR